MTSVLSISLKAVSSAMGDNLGRGDNLVRQLVKLGVFGKNPDGSRRGKSSLGVMVSR